MKKLYLLIFFIWAANFVLSQNSRTVRAYYTQRSDDLIVRTYYQYPKSIASSYNSAHDCSFFCFQLDNQNYKSRIVPNIYVHDFVIYHDSVFFCGENNEGRGVIGFFDINDFFYSNGDYYVQDYFYWDNDYYVKNLYKLIVFDGSHGEAHVFAIGYYGRSYDNTSDCFACIVDMMDYRYWGGFSNYILGTFEKRPYNTFLDVALVGDYIVTVGHEPYLSLGVRVFRKDYINMMSGPQNRTLFIDISAPVGSIICEEDNALVTEVSSKTFATATITKQLFGQMVFNQRVHLMLLDLDSVIDQSVNTILSSRQLQMGMNTPQKLDEFRHNPDVQRYSVLFQTHYQNPLLTVDRSIFAELSSNFNTLVMAVRDDDTVAFCDYLRYRSFDFFASNSKYLLFGNCYSDTFEKFFQFETTGMQSTCIPSTEGTLTYLDNINQHYYVSEMNSVYRDTDIQTGLNGSPYNLYMSIECN